jgi:hypothetical protein
MHIIELKAENFKRLKAVRIECKDGKLVRICGRNNQGKTSVLDAITAGIGGKDYVPQVPVRAGQKQATIDLDLGDFRIQRVIYPDRSGHLVLTDRNGNRIKQPQRVLDRFISEMCLDPMQFMFLKSSDRIEQLKKLIPEFDFQSNSAQRAAAYGQRTEYGRDYQRYKGALEVLPPQPEERPQSTNVADALRQLQEAEAHNLNVADNQALRDRQDVALQNLEVEIESLRKALKGKIEDLLIMQEVVDSREPLPKLIDTAPLQAAIVTAQTIDRQIEDWDRHARLERDTEQAQSEVRRLDDVIRDYDDLRDAAIRNAKLPVEGLGFGADDVTIDGLPFEQASSSTQLTIATGITMALRPTLRIILLREAPLLDEEHMILVAQIAEKAGYQLWAERLPGDGEETGIWIEDGEVLQLEAAHAKTETQHDGHHHRAADSSSAHAD